MTLQDRVVMITGAAEGIGAACAEEFARRGARLSLIDVQPPTGQPAACWTTGDITSPAIAELALSRTLAVYGTIDVLINNAGIGLYASASETPVELAQRIFDVNLFAVVHLTSLVVPYLRAKRSGSVVNIGSIGGLVSLPWCALYCASKHALHAYSDSLRRELAGDGVHVMTVIPGIVGTQFREHVLGGRAPGGVTSLKRIISPEDLAGTIAEGVIKRKRFAMNPRIGSVFSAVDYFFPKIMDLYCRSRWTSEEVVARECSVAAIGKPKRV